MKSCPHSRALSRGLSALTQARTEGGARRCESAQHPCHWWPLAKLCPWWLAREGQVPPWVTCWSGWASCSGAVCGFRGDLGHLDTRVLKTAGPAKSPPWCLLAEWPLGTMPLPFLSTPHCWEVWLWCSLHCVSGLCFQYFSLDTCLSRLLLISVSQFLLSGIFLTF